MLTIMGGIAEFERGLIRQRTDEGIERATAPRSCLRASDAVGEAHDMGDLAVLQRVEGGNRLHALLLRVAFAAERPDVLPHSDWSSDACLGAHSRTHVGHHRSPSGGPTLTKSKRPVPDEGRTARRNSSMNRRSGGIDGAGPIGGC